MTAKTTCLVLGARFGWSRPLFSIDAHGSEVGDANAHSSSGSVLQAVAIKDLAMQMTDNTAEFVGESDLIRRARAGDRDAFGGLVRHYWQLVYRWLYHRTHRHHTAEDLTQEAFLKAFTGLASFRTGSTWRPWLR